jgi:hypothetical protein
LERSQRSRPKHRTAAERERADHTAPCSFRSVLLEGVAVLAVICGLMIVFKSSIR